MRSLPVACPARRSTISRPSHSRGGISSADIALAAGIYPLPAGLRADRFRCSPAAAARNSARTVRIEFSPPIATRPVQNIVDELQYLCAVKDHPYVVFRDPLFSEDRSRCLELCDEIASRGLALRFECETRLDRLDPELLVALRRAGLAAISFGVETSSDETLKRSGRRPIPSSHQRRIMIECRRLGIVTAAFYVLGFLQDDWSSIAATIDYSIGLGSTTAQFKLLTPYPGTPMWKQLSAACLRNRLATVRRIHAHLHASVADAPTSCGSFSARRIHASTYDRRISRTSSVCAGADCAPPNGSIPACSRGTNATSAPSWQRR